MAFHTYSKLHVKSGDTVLVLSGNDKGKQGVIKEAYPKEGRILIEGVNLRWRHQKPTQQRPKGDRVQREAPIFASKVKLVAAGKGPAASTKAPAKAAKAGKTKKAKSAASGKSE